MYCKECGTKINEGDKFCPSCGTRVEVTTIPVEPEISMEEQPIATTSSDNGFYCTYCGENIGTAKKCPKCRTKAVKNFKRFCRYCGGTIEKKKCTSCHTSCRNNIIESLLRFVCCVLIGVSFFGALVDLLTEKPIAAVLIEFLIPLLLCIFVVRKKQIFKIKKLLIKKSLKPFLTILVYVLVGAIVIGGIGFAGVVARDNTVYEEQFIGKWSNSEALFSFQYKDGVYCGGGISSDFDTVVFTKYTATEDTLTLYMDDGRVEKLSYRFSNGYLYLEDSRFAPFNSSGN